MNVIAVTFSEECSKSQAHQLAQHLQCSSYHSDHPALNHYIWTLQYTSYGLKLQHTQDAHQCLTLDFNSGAKRYRRLHGGGTSQPIAKAIGIKKYTTPPLIIDATAGLGQDSFVLASLGCTVIAIERSPILAALLQDALERARCDTEIADIATRITVITGDACNLLPQLTIQQPQVIYLDPMFPERHKTALVKKELRLIRELVGNDHDADSLLPCALQYAPKVVVKRPKIAPLLNAQQPSWQLLGERNRFDIYTPRISSFGEVYS